MLTHFPDFWRKQQDAFLADVAKFVKVCQDRGDANDFGYLKRQSVSYVITVLNCYL